ncbi:MAG: EamA family transporter RarD [Microbacteriaceae bacterium]
MFRGVVASVLASAGFAVMFFFSTLFPGVSPEEVFGWRVLISILPVSAYLLVTKEYREIFPLFKMIRKRPWVVFLLILSAILIGSQQWLFMWGPVNGAGLEVSMGYFLLPLSLVLIGRFVYRERLSRFQIWASIIAASGVGFELIRTGAFSWVTALVCLTYPIYFVIRRELGTIGIFGLWLDFAMLVPVAIYFVFSYEGGSQVVAGGLGWEALGLGLVSTLAMMFYITSNQALPMSLFGLLSYVEPVLLVFVALFLGETIVGIEWVLYIFIWTAIALLCIEAIVQYLKRPENREPAAITGPIIV